MTRRFQAVAVLFVLLAMCATAVAGVTTTFYGYIKLDASFDSAMTNDGNYVYYVERYAEGEEDDEFNMTARQTRFGVKFDGGGSDAVKLSGLIEYDFYAGDGENKPNPMLRKAYMEFKTSAVDILAGQTSDVISPIVPTTLNYIVLWKSGDIGYRRPQIRLTKAVEVSDNAKIKLQASLNRSMGRDANGGETVAMPSFQGRLAVGAKLMDNYMELGVSGLMGREEATHPVTETVYELDSSVVAVDVTLPLGDMVALKGQYFTGSNLGQYLGGIGQSIATVRPVWNEEDEKLVEIEASGWWAQVTVKPVENWQFNVGGGSDDPEFDDNTVGDTLDKNTTYYGNVIWTVAPSATIGVEYAMFETEYRYVTTEEEAVVVSTESYENNRVQLSFMYKF